MRNGIGDDIVSGMVLEVEYGLGSGVGKSNGDKLRENRRWDLRQSEGL